MAEVDNSIVCYTLVMLKIYLARHGQDQDNADNILNGHRDEALTDIGIAQAHSLAEKVAATGIQFDKVYTSPLQRAYNTAAIITNTVGLPTPEIMPELIERDFGIMTGKPLSQIMALCAPDVLQTDTITYFLSPEGAETFPQLLVRTKQLLAHIKSMHRDGAILLVTHGDVGKMICAAYYDVDWIEMLQMFHFGNSDLLELSEDSGIDQAHIHQVVQHNL
jgi:broad specificity phosphatase PhoE